MKVISRELFLVRFHVMIQVFDIVGGTLEEFIKKREMVVSG